MAMIDLMASLRDVSAKGKTGQKFAISFKVTKGLFFNPDEKSLALPVAQAMADQIGNNLLGGKKPDGASMPGIEASTVQWREREASQGARGGEADSRYKDEKFRAKAKRNYDRDYRSKLGSFTPHAGGTRGVLSNLLAKSFAVRLDKSGRGFTIYVASRRGRPRKGETKSALESVFGNVELWNQAAMNTPHIQEVMQKAVQGMLSNSATNIFKELQKTASLIGRLASTVDDFGSDD